MDSLTASTDAKVHTKVIEAHQVKQIQTSHYMTAEPSELALCGQSVISICCR